MVRITPALPVDAHKIGLSSQQLDRQLAEQSGFSSLFSGKNKASVVTAQVFGALASNCAVKPS